MATKPSKPRSKRAKQAGPKRPGSIGKPRTSRDGKKPGTSRTSSTANPLFSDTTVMSRMLDLMDLHALTEIEIRDGDQVVRLARGTIGAALPTGSGILTGPTSVQSIGFEATSGAPASSNEVASGHQIKTPFVGTFYRSPSPNDPPFVTEGQRVSVGQTLCIVEAMKLMNEIESDVAGVVRSVLVENGSPVDFGQPLFEIETS